MVMRDQMQLEVNTPDSKSFETTDRPEYCIEIMQFTNDPPSFKFYILLIYV